ncbi:PAS sensor protein [Oleidesulfovibrio alaskensis G20]|uniref:PAS sensor protein n=1 Tax=Oleidesulfovibrio alaskensis (strain ATCC BAA-1058 / DSM 17464 / G20) TaxID=207559 RepID=Q30UW3_OLEA2|nr:LuxR C-terminal-related transcriptional regulator [Oleidesulfovibrio alaskensis]ABB40533.1 PAS sensor protein [Oleidesulfovibrio alaskensis G20]MBG0774564.1 PAS domain S-box protein [Oleidesulfovibrio alaskensis]
MNKNDHNTPPVCAPGDVVEAWDDVILYTDAAGTVTAGNGKALHYLPQSGRAGAPFWQTLRLGTQSLQQTLHRFAPMQIHEISGTHGERFLLRIIPVHPSLSSRGGFVVVATDNRPLEALHETYEERLGDNISAWADSITLFNALFDTAKDATFLINEQGIILTANPAAGTRHAPSGGELAGNPAETLAGASFRPRLHNAMQTLRPRTVWAEKIVALDAQGEGYPAEAILRKMEFSGYSLFQLILHDLSAQVELKKDLQAQKAEVEKMNIALRQVIRTVEEERQEIREQLTSQVKKQLLPALERITKAETPEVREGYRNVIQEQLNGLTDTAGVEDADLLRLSPREMEVCQLIQLGRNGQEIAALLNMSFETVQTHRKNIRRKLGLKGRTVSLFSYLRRKPALS